MAILNLKKNLSKGLRQEDRNSVDNLGFVSLINLQPTVHGLTTVDVPDDSWFKSLSEPWPFPQVWRMKDGKIIVAGQTTIWELNRSTLVFEVLITDLPKGGGWHITDMFKTWAATNGVCVVSHANGHTDVHTAPVVQSCVEFQERGFWGGFDGSSDPFYMSKADKKYQPGVAMSSPLPSYYVSWSSVLGGDLFEYFRESIRSGSHLKRFGHDSNQVLEYLERGDSGGGAIKFLTTVRKMMAIGIGNQANLVVYGDDGIAMLSPMIDPSPTMSIQHLSNLGINSRSAVSSDNNRSHLFVDGDGNLWLLGNDKKLEKKGYKEFISTSGEVVVSHDPIMNQFFITDGVKGFVFNEFGLAEISQMPSAMQRIDNSLMAPLKYTSVATGEVSMKTDTMLMEDSDIKTFTQVGANYRNLKNVFAAFEARIHPGADWVSTEWFAANDNGISYPRITGVDVRVKVKGEVEDTLKVAVIDNLWVTYQTMGDRS